MQYLIVDDTRGTVRQTDERRFEVQANATSTIYQHKQTVGLPAPEVMIFEEISGTTEPYKILVTTWETEVTMPLIQRVLHLALPYIEEDDNATV